MIVIIKIYVLQFELINYHRIHLISNDFFLFPKFEVRLEEQRFSSNENTDKRQRLAQMATIFTGIL